MAVPNTFRFDNDFPRDLAGPRLTAYLDARLRNVNLPAGRSGDSLPLVTGNGSDLNLLAPVYLSDATAVAPLTARSSAGGGPRLTETAQTTQPTSGSLGGSAQMNSTGPTAPGGTIDAQLKGILGTAEDLVAKVPSWAYLAGAALLLWWLFFKKK